MKKILIFATLFFHKSILAQTKALSVGDELPMAAWTQLTSLQPAPQKNNTIFLIELWSGRCGGCLASMEKLHALQQKFGKTFQPFLVTYESKKEMEAFLKKRPGLAAFKLSYAPSSKQWEAWFPHRSWPHLVWIGADKKIKAITSITYLTEKNLSFLQQNNFIHLPVKKDLIGFSTKEPLLQPRAEQKILWYASITGPVEGLGAGGGAINKVDDEFKKLHLINSSLNMLYATAYASQLYIDPGEFNKKIVLDLKDSSLFKKDEYGQAPSFCYELVMPLKMAADKNKVFTMMQQDLDRFFGLKTSIKTIKRKALVLVPITIEKEENTEQQESGNTVSFQNMPPLTMITIVNNILHASLPIVYEGTDNLKFGGRLKRKYESNSELAADLRRIGLDLEEKETAIKVLYITEAQ